MNWDRAGEQFENCLRRELQAANGNTVAGFNTPRKYHVNDAW